MTSPPGRGPGTAMPPAEVQVDESLVTRLLTDQHPDLSDLEPVVLANGWDNMIFRLGDELTVRLPRRAVAAELVRNEQRWLPVIGPDLSLPTPIPVRVGRATTYYPWDWSVLPWFPGTEVGVDPPIDRAEAATAMGRFLASLHKPAPADAPVNRFRGGPLAGRDSVTRERIDLLAGVVDPDSVLQRWRRCLALPPWDGPPLWLHGDLHPLNILHRDGHLSAVIDFGDITSGDPATDLAIGFSLFDGADRAAFRLAADSPERPIDDAMWGRAQGWALSVGLAVLANSADSPRMQRLGQRMVASV